MISSLACYAVTKFEGSGIKMFIFQCMIHLAVYGTGLLVFGLNKKEREVLIKPAKKLIKSFGFTNGENAPNIL